MDFEAGEVLYIDKPLHWTSFDVVNKIRLSFRTILGIKKIKVGHAGTLDPLATGIVTVCTGRATKRIDGLMNHDKEYVATIRFGATTPSFDLETDVDQTFATEHITRDKLETVIANQFLGQIEQVPPMHSAIRVGGKRAYEFARQGKQDEVELKSRSIRIEQMLIEEFEMPYVQLRIRCSKGTYIRALARDLGIAMNSGAHLTQLRRTAVGDINENQCISIDQAIELLQAEALNRKENNNIEKK